MNIGLGVFAHEGSTLLVLFNSLRMLAPMSETVAHTSKIIKNAYADLMAIQHKRSLLLNNIIDCTLQKSEEIGRFC